MHIEPIIEEFCQYSQYIQGLSAVTVASYKGVIRTFVRRTGVQTTDDLDKKLLMNYFLEGRAKRGWRSGTFTTYYMNLRAFFSWCCDMNYLVENPVIGIRYPKPKRRIPTRLNRYQAEELLELACDYPYTNPVLRYRNLAVMATFIFTGLRKSELLGVQLKDLDMVNDTIFVAHAKGGKERIVPIPPRLRTILTEYLTERERLGRTTTALFVSSNKDAGLSHKGWDYLVNLMKEASGIDFSAHVLRHTFATLMLEGGCDLFTLSKIMGHGSLEMTKIYLEATTLHKQNEAIKHPLNFEVSR